jgi:4-amino-4-deoxy-L-arabinose transferase-like glycosyltransferase
MAVFAAEPELSRRPLSLVLAAPVVAAVLFWLGALGWWSLTRERRFTADSRNYVNVARNVLAGRGLVQDSVGYGENRFPTRARFPQPFGVHGPLYPLAIAAFASFGMPAEDAALLIPVLAAASTLAAAWAFVRRLYDPQTGLFAILLLVVSFPVAFLAGTAWSELLAIAFLFGSLAALVSRPPGELRAPVILAAGLAAGLGFAARYPLAVALPLGLPALVARDGLRANLRRALLYVLGFAVVAAPIVIRNLLVLGRLTGAERGPSTIGLRQNVSAAARALLNQWLLGPTSRGSLPLGLVLTGVLLLVFASWLWSHRAGRRWLIEQRRLLIWAWPLGYTAYMVAQRSLLHFDPLGPRLLGPAMVFVPLLVAVALRAMLPVKLPWLAVAVTVVVLFRGGSIVERGRRVSPADDPRPGQDSERLRWVKKQTGPRDLVIAQRGTDIAFFLGRSSLYFTKQPEMAPVTRDALRALVADACPRYERIFLVLLKYRGNERSWQRGYGPFVTDLVTGRTADYPEVVPEAELRDGTVFRLVCPTGT